MFRWRDRPLDIEYKTPEQIGAMRAAGRVVVAALAATRDAVAPGVSTAELDAVAEEAIRSAGAEPSFKGYYGFPASICASVGHEVVHGIPSRETVLREGDVVSIDCGAILDGWHGDAAVTVPVGAVDPAVTTMTAVAEEAMWAGIAAAARAVQEPDGGRLSDISHAVESTVRRQSPRRQRYGIVTGYGGHGIGTEMHQDPHVLNHGRPGRGPRLEPGMALAVEPMLTLGRPRTAELADEWTVVTVDRSVAVHVEHSFALMADGVWVLTAEDGGVSRLGGLCSAHAA